MIFLERRDGDGEGVGDLGVPAAFEPAIRLFPDQPDEMAHPPGPHAGLGGQDGESPSQCPRRGLRRPGGHDPPGQAGDEELVDARGRRFGIHDPVPDGEHFDGPERVGVGRIQRQDGRPHLPPRDTRQIHLKLSDVGEGPTGDCGETLGDPCRPVPVEEVESDERIGVAGHRFVVRRGDEARSGVDRAREFVDAETVVLPSRTGDPPGRRKGSPPPFANRELTDQLPCDGARLIGGDDVEGEARPAPVRLLEAVDGPRFVECQDPAGGCVVQPDGTHRHGDFTVERRPDQRTVRRLEHVDRHRVAVLDLDGLMVHGARDELVPDPDAGPVFADLFEEQVGVVGQTGSHAPGGVPVESDREAGRSQQGRSGDLPVGGRDVCEVPVGRHRRGEVGIVGDDRVARRRPGAGDRPVVGSPATADGRLEPFEIVGETVDDRSGRRTRRVDRRQPLRVGGVEVHQRTGSVLGEDLVADEFGVPVRGEEETHQLHQPQGVGRFIRGWFALEQCELVRRLG